LVLVNGIVTAQTIDVMNEEIMRWRNVSYNILHLYVDVKLSDFGIPDLYSYRPIPIIREICDHLQKINLISAVDQTSLQKIDLDQFDWDLDLIGWRGGHPIFEWWNPTSDWHVILFRNRLYIIKGRNGFRGEIYRINIKN
jgi:hypothetical protein